MTVDIKERESGIQEKHFILMKGILSRRKINSRLKMGKDVNRVGKIYVLF